MARRQKLRRPWIENAHMRCSYRCRNRFSIRRQSVAKKRKSITWENYLWKMCEIVHTDSQCRAFIIHRKNYQIDFDLADRAFSVRFTFALASSFSTRSHVNIDASGQDSRNTYKCHAVNHCRFRGRQISLQLANFQPNRKQQEPRGERLFIDEFRWVSIPVSKLNRTRVVTRAITVIMSSNELCYGHVMLLIGLFGLWNAFSFWSCEMHY